MKHIVIIILTLFSIASFAQDKDKEAQEMLAKNKANDLVYDANILVDNEDYVSAEMEYRKAISEQPNYAVGAYNLANTYYKKGIYDEALYRLKQTAKYATTKDEKYKAYHNIGNILMQNKQCKEAAEAFKNALRNNPLDDQTRYNYALAKECAEQQQDQQDQNKDQNEENKDDQQEQEDQKDQDQEKDQDKDKENENQDKDQDQQDEGDQDKKEGEDEKDEDGNPKDEKEDEGKGGEEEQKENPKPQQQPGQLSPQQVKNLLEAMNDQEQKVQDKMNAQKTKGERVQTEKDW
ncbi:tetratricopeptide repeat protein [Lacinutrix sp. C3R15]|uniref:tetratricopeptide repeat protein n=1 Tax=Flavobacteriaceae TaxID=49546 RepID=UPI001C08F8F4|nr:MULTISPECIES: tetratricopeptide repeat protein [Flavobacteriaceae]MBU2940975.1 tetratricopeptide repeat protein [Lacinutrix sp. C3R15]MDO6624294.1 tetratricopeptide repeat protein [Oceanihabitans sp. 1_MG-2023]